MSSLVPGCLYIAAPVYIILYRIPAFLGNVLIYGGRGEIPSWFSFSAGPQKTVFLRVLHWPTQSRGLSEIQKLWFGISSALVNLIFWPYSLWLWDTMCNTTRNLWVTASCLHTFLIIGVLSVNLEKPIICFEVVTNISLQRSGTSEIVERRWLSGHAGIFLNILKRLCLDA